MQEDLFTKAMYRPNWLIIMGTNRNAGKTTLACDIIRQFAPDHPVTAIKISPHFHRLDADEEILEQNTYFTIVRENHAGGNKDSRRMKQAGAHHVFYLQVFDDSLEKAVRALDRYIDPEGLVVCESGWARSIIKPGIFLMLHRHGERMLKANSERFRPLADRLINFNGSHFDFSVNELLFDGLSWRIK